MIFERKKINTEKYICLDIGSYKLRAWLVSFSQEKIQIHKYQEKRQNTSFFSNGECRNIHWLTESIKELQEKLCESEKKDSYKLIINYPFWKLHTTALVSNFPRNTENPISQSECINILADAERKCLTKEATDIEKLYGSHLAERDIIFSRITSLSCDGKKCHHIIWKQAQNVKITLINITIPHLEHTLLSDIAEYTKNTLEKIIPVEYSLWKYFIQKDIVIIVIWATQTFISIKKNNILIGTHKLGIGMQDLIKNIAKSRKITKSEALKKLNGDYFWNEKKYFCDIWIEAIALSLKETLGKQICPKYFYLWGGGKDNIFLSDALKNFWFEKYEVILPSSREMVEADTSSFLKDIDGLTLEHLQNIPFEFFVMLEEMKDIKKYEKNSLSQSLVLALEKLWYTL